MKQNHLYQQKVSGLLLRMIINIIPFFLCFGCNTFGKSNLSSSKALSPDDIDTIFVLCMDLDTEYPINVSKEFFLCRNIRTEEARHAIITTHEEIENIVRIINSLKIYSGHTPSDSKFYYMPIISKTGQLFLLNTYPLDIRGLMIISQRGVCKPVWISTSYIDIDNTFYKTSDDFLELIDHLNGE